MCQRTIRRRTSTPTTYHSNFAASHTKRKKPPNRAAFLSEVVCLEAATDVPHDHMVMVSLPHDDVAAMFMTEPDLRSVAFPVVPVMHTDADGRPMPVPVAPFADGNI